MEISAGIISTTGEVVEVVDLVEVASRSEPADAMFRDGPTDATAMVIGSDHQPGEIPADREIGVLVPADSSVGDQFLLESSDEDLAGLWTLGNLRRQVLQVSFGIISFSLRDEVCHCRKIVAGRLVDLQSDHRHDIDRSIRDVSDKLLGHASSSTAILQDNNTVTEMMVPSIPVMAF